MCAKYKALDVLPHLFSSVDEDVEAPRGSQVCRTAVAVRLTALLLHLTAGQSGFLLSLKI